MDLILYCALSSNSESLDDEVDEIVAVKKDVKNKFSVSAEAYGQFNKKENFKAKLIPKSKEQSEQIKQRMQAGFMFSAINDKEIEIVVGAMEEKIFHKSEYVIKQGEEGNENWIFLRIMEKVMFIQKHTILEKVLVNQHYYFNLQKLLLLKLKVIKLFFGNQIEIHQFNCQRSLNQKKKTIIRIVQLMFFIMKFFENWELLKEIKDPYDKLNLSDALFEKQFKKGDAIIQQGQKSNQIFIIEQAKQKIFQLDKLGEYLGDQSIISNTLESFSYMADEDSKLIYIPKKSYSSTLQEIQDTLIKNNQIKYGNIYDVYIFNKPKILIYFI